MKKTCKSLFVFLIISAWMCGCGSGVGTDLVMNSTSKDYAYSEAYDGMNASGTQSDKVQEEHGTGEDVSYSTQAVLSQEKLVYRCNITIESKTYEDSYQYIKGLIDKYDGFVQEEHQSDNDYGWYYADYVRENATRSAWLNCRIPSKNYDAFLAEVEEPNNNSKVTNKTSNVENISQQYYDNGIRIEALNIQEARLLEMLQQADTIQDMLSVESRLTDVQTELNLLTNKRASMDMDVAYSYVDISLEEVMEYTVAEEKSTFFTRMGDTFLDVCKYTGNLFEEVLTFIMYLIPFVVIVGTPVWMVIKLAKAIIKKKNLKLYHLNAPLEDEPIEDAGKFSGRK